MTDVRKLVKMPGICDANCLKKFEKLLTQEFSTEQDTSPSSNIKYKVKLERSGFLKEVHVEVFTNNRIGIKTSPEMQSAFGPICSRIEDMLREATSVTSRKGGTSVRVGRAKTILDYIQTIPLTSEIGRMTIVVLSDIVIDLIVTEKLSNFTRNRQDLENESVSAKVSHLENRIPVYSPERIRDIRDLRNKIAHGGNPTNEREATLAMEGAKDIYELF